jgi:hypothetical protein
MYKLLLALVISFASMPASAQVKAVVYTHPKDSKEDSIFYKIMNLDKVKLKDLYIRKQSNGKRHLQFMIYLRPSSQFRWYWVKVVEDNGSRYHAHYNFYVEPRTLSIFFFDTMNNKIMDLETWKKSSDF